jgi:Ca-activated chloride channel homolog
VNGNPHAAETGGIQMEAVARGAPRSAALACHRSNRNLRAVCFWALLILCAVSPVPAQMLPLGGTGSFPFPAAYAPQGGTIRISTSMVLVPVSVTDTGGHPVRNLQLDDFQVLENGSPVTIEHLGEPGQTRLEMVLVFDVTGSTRPRFDFEQQAATSFLKALLRPKDTVSIVCITSRPQILLPRTESLIAALDGLEQIQPQSTATAFFDSIIAAAELFRGPSDSETRRAMVVLSDGEDNMSHAKLADALREVQQADSIFYSINPNAPSLRLNGPSVVGQKGMEALAQQTGGAAFAAEKLQDLGGIYGRIAAELQAQYLLSYYSPDPRMDGNFRTISVTVPKHAELRVRSRQGYYARRAASK